MERFDKQPDNAGRNMCWFTIQVLLVQVLGLTAVIMVAMSTIKMHRYQNTFLKWTILAFIGNDLGQWQLHIIYNFLADLHQPEMIFIDFYYQWSLNFPTPYNFWGVHISTICCRPFRCT
jgi:hypothetical protein